MSDSIITSEPNRITVTTGSLVTQYSDHPLSAAKQITLLHTQIKQLTERLAEAEAELNECRSDLSSTIADWKDAHDGKMIAETAAFFLLEVCKHTDEVRYEQALKHWPFLEEAKGGRDGKGTDSDDAM